VPTAMDCLFKKLGHYCDMGLADREALEAIPTRPVSYAPGEDVVIKGDDPIDCFIVSQGWAARYISLEDGRSQILNFMLPGDMYDLQVLMTTNADHSISAITPLEILKIHQRDILALFAGPTRAGIAFWWSALHEEAILREQIVRNGRRTARECIAHLLLELHRRAVIAGEGEGNSFRMPISQIHVADALGLSFVHVNRVIREFVRQEMIDRDKDRLMITDRNKLIKISGFDADYLHLDAAPRRLALDSID